MPSYKIAHLNRSGQDMVIVPLDSSYDSKSSSEQAGFEGLLQNKAYSAGLAGDVVTVWEKGGQMRFRAPVQWHPFFKSIGMNYVLQNVNRTLSW